MKEFIVYTAMRLALLLASFFIVVSVWSLVFGSVNMFGAIVISFVVSGIASWWVLNSPRTAFARRVEERATRASAAFEARKAREDVD